MVTVVLLLFVADLLSGIHVFLCVTPFALHCYDCPSLLRLFLSANSAFSYLDVLGFFQSSSSRRLLRHHSSVCMPRMALSDSDHLLLHQSPGLLRGQGVGCSRQEKPRVITSRTKNMDTGWSFVDPVWRNHHTIINWTLVQCRIPNGPGFLADILYHVGWNKTARG